MRCLVTGAAGFIGSHLTDRLLADGHEVVGLDNLVTGRLDNLAAAGTNPSFSFVARDVAAIEAADLKGIDWLFHLAGLADLVPSIEKPELYYHANVHATFKLLDACRAQPVKRFIHTASSTCYGIPDRYPTPEETPCQPEHPYALTKYLGEQMVMHWASVYDLPAVSLRLFNVFGPRARTKGTYGAVFGVFLAQKLAGQPYTVVGDGSQRRDFTYVTDIADAMVTAAGSRVVGEVINIGTGDPQSVARLVELLGGDCVHIPRRPGEPDATWADTTKARELLGWQSSVRFEEGVANMLGVIDHFQDAPVWTPDSISQATAGWFRHLGKEEQP